MVRLLFLVPLGFLIVTVAEAQPRATGPVATMNAEAKKLSESDPERSLAVALQARTAAKQAGDRRGEAEAHNYVAYGYRNQSLLDLARSSALASIQLYAAAGDAWGEAQGHNTMGLIEADAGRFPEALDRISRPWPSASGRETKKVSPIRSTTSGTPIGTLVNTRELSNITAAGWR